jgi:hypothetical protein
VNNLIENRNFKVTRLYEIKPLEVGTSEGGGGTTYFCEEEKGGMRKKNYFKRDDYF